MSHETKTDEIDINEVFDDLLNLEDKLADQGYSEGYQKGVESGNQEAYHLGFHRGAEIGAELGFILGVVESLPATSRSQKVETLIENLKKLIEDFPRTNDETVNLHESLDHIKTQYKKLVSLAKIKVPTQEKKEISF